MRLARARDLEAGRGPEDRADGRAGVRAAVDGRDRGGAASTWGDARAIECGEYRTHDGRGPGGGASRGSARAGGTIEAGGCGSCRRTGILFSTETGDAWLLDVTDKLAALLARDGDPEPIHLEETETSFAIGWKGHYHIDGPAFVYSDRDTRRVTTIIRYPTKKIAQAG
jgi:hypothetical protein